MVKAKISVKVSCNRINILSMLPLQNHMME